MWELACPNSGQRIHAYLARQLAGIDFSISLPGEQCPRCLQDPFLAAGSANKCSIPVRLALSSAGSDAEENWTLDCPVCNHGVAVIHTNQGTRLLFTMASGSYFCGCGRELFLFPAPNGQETFRLRLTWERPYPSLEEVMRDAG